jgi:hypothetical protein
MSIVPDLILDDIICDKIIAKKRGYCPHKPHKKQAEFLALNDLEAMYGGAAGGGKSDALLMGALEHVDQPEYSALILRRTFRDLNQPKAIMFRCHQWLRNTDAKWNAQAKRYTFPSGATLTFGYLDSEGDKDQYASAEFHYIGFDELTQFPEAWYRFMFSRLRRLKNSKIPMKMRSATNPGNIGHAWVKRRFVDKETAEGAFVPALLDDNPHVDVEDYKQNLSKLDKISRDQLEKGIWRNDASGLVYNFDITKNVIITAPQCHQHVLGIDYGATRDACSFSVLGWQWHKPTVYILKSYRRKKMIPSETAEEAVMLNEEYNFQRIIGDANGLGTTGGYIGEARRRFKVPVEAARKNDKPGYIKLFNGDLERGLIKVVASECQNLIDEWSELPWADEGRSKEAEGFDNHCADGSLYGWRACNAFMTDMASSKPTSIPSPFVKW